jgi:hypothetical protein
VGVSSLPMPPRIVPNDGVVEVTRPGAVVRARARRSKPPSRRHSVSWRLLGAQVASVAVPLWKSRVGVRNPSELLMSRTAKVTTPAASMVTSRRMSSSAPKAPPTNCSCQTVMPEGASPPCWLRIQPLSSLELPGWSWSSRSVSRTGSPSGRPKMGSRSWSNPLMLKAYPPASLMKLSDPGAGLFSVSRVMSPGSGKSTTSPARSTPTLSDCASTVPAIAATSTGPRVRISRIALTPFSLPASPGPGAGGTPAEISGRCPVVGEPEVW